MKRAFLIAFVAFISINAVAQTPGYLPANIYSTNYSLALDGINDFGSIANPFFTNINQRDFTIEFYMKPNATQSQYPGIWGKTGYWSEINVHLYQPGKVALMYATTVGGNQYFNSDTVSWQSEKWDHYAIVGEATNNQLRIYKNGVLDAIKPHGTPVWSIPNNDSKIGAVYQGWTAPNTQYFKGKLDDFRVSDIARYNTNFTPPKNIVADVNTRVLYNFNSINNNIVPDLSGNNNNLTLQNGASLDADVPYTINTVLPNNIPTNGLVAYYPFNGNANDVSGNGNNGVVNSATLTTDRFGLSNSAYNFDGVNDYIQTINSGPSGTGITVSFWLKSSSRIRNTNILEYGGTQWGSYFNATLNDWAGNSNCYGITFQIGGALISRGNTLGLDSNMWHHCVLILPANASSLNDVSFYINGNLLSGVCSYANYGAPAPSISSINQIRIGRGWQRDGYYKGKLDDIGIWNRVLTQSEITALYNQAPNPALPSYVPTNGLVAYYPFNGNANDVSGNGNNGIVNGATLSTNRFGNFNNAYYFDGNDKISLGRLTTIDTLNINKNISYSIWIKAEQNQSTFAKMPLITKRQAPWQTAGYTQSYFTLHAGGQDFYSRSNKYICYGFVDVHAYTTGINNGLDGGVTNDNNWHHIAATKNGFKYKIYFDGQLVDSIIDQSTLFSIDSMIVGFQGMWGFNAERWYKGHIDDIGIWNRALTQSEITALYNAPTPSISDSLWVLNNQTDTLTFPSQVKLSLKSNNITSKNISAYDIKLNYDASRLKFDSVTKINSASANGSIVVNSSTAGQVNIAWACSSSISSATLQL